MCLIVDANLASLVFGQEHDDFRPLIDWLVSPKKDGKLVVGGRLAVELDKVLPAKRFIRSLLQAGRAKQIPDDVINEEETLIADSCKSDDPHVIALARISGARILCSHDKTLHKDFKNEELVSNPKGRIYQNAKHVPLLRKYGHSEACGESSQ
jgi:hypothetical protein